MNEEKDRRDFKRYKGEAECILSIGDNSYKCKIIDYSVEGIGVYIEGTPALKTGNIVGIEVRNPEMQFRGQIIWMKELPTGLSMGLKRVDRLTGYLKDFQLSDILIGIQRGTRTGILEIVSEPVRKKIYIKKGDMIFAGSNQEDDRLGEVLLKAKQITIEQYNEAVAIFKKTGEKLGRVFINLGYFKPKELFRAVQFQIREIILSLFTFEEGAFQFIEGPLPPDETITLRLSAANLIYNGIKRINNFNLIRRNCPPLDTVLSLSKNPVDLFQDISLHENDKEILSVINSEKSVRDILSLSPINNFETMKTLYAFLSARIITEEEDKEVTLKVPVEDVIKETQPVIGSEFIEKIKNMHANVERLGYYGILGIKEDASGVDIEKAYIALARDFHPDKHFSIKEEGVKEKLNSIFSSLTQAYEVLSDPDRREEYDRTLSVSTQSAAGEFADLSVSGVQEPDTEAEEDVYVVEAEEGEGISETVDAAGAVFETADTGEEFSSEEEALDEYVIEDTKTVQGPGSDIEEFTESTQLEEDSVVKNDTFNSGQELGSKDEDVGGVHEIEDTTEDLSGETGGSSDPSFSQDQEPGSEAEEEDVYVIEAEEGEGISETVDAAGAVFGSVDTGDRFTSEEEALDEYVIEDTETVQGPGSGREEFLDSTQLEEDTMVKNDTFKSGPDPIGKDEEGGGVHEIDDTTEDLSGETGGTPDASFLHDQEPEIEHDQKTDAPFEAFDKEESHLETESADETPFRAEETGASTIKTTVPSGEEEPSVEEEVKSPVEKVPVSTAAMSDVSFDSYTTSKSLPKWDLKRTRTKRKLSVPVVLISVGLLVAVFIGAFLSLRSNFQPDVPVVAEMAKNVVDEKEISPVAEVKKEPDKIVPEATLQTVQLPSFRDKLFQKMMNN